MNLRPMHPADLDEVVALEALSNPRPWTRAQFDEELRNPRAHLYVAVDEARVAAHLCTWWIVDELHIQNIATHPQYRRRGIARQLLVHAAREAERCTRALLEVRAGNANAIALYGSLGFVRVGLRRRYYAPDGEDAVLMTAAMATDGTYRPPSS